MTAPVFVLTPNLRGGDGISKLARLVTRAFDHVTVLAMHEPPTAPKFGEVDICGAGGHSSSFVASAVRHAVRCDPGSLIIAVHLHLAPAALAFVARGASLATILCGVEAWKPLTWPQHAALERSHRVIAISQFTRERFCAANPRFLNRAIDVCYPGIESAAAPAGTPGEPPSVLIVGRMADGERYKGHDALLEIWSDVVAAVPGASLRIVGDGNDRLRLERKAAALGLSSSVTFLGRLDDDAVSGEYKRCTAFVMPSRDEGFGFVFVEAMRAARPCIGARGAASEIIAADETGLLVDADNRSELCEAVIRMLRDRSMAAEMGRRGRARFLERFTEARFRDQLAALMPSVSFALPTGSR